MCCVTFYRIAATMHTVIGLSVTNSRWQLDAILGTFTKDFYLKTRINNFYLLFYSFHSCSVLLFVNYIINLYVCMYVHVCM